uniref:BRCT domain-containing protein n=1 Tax=Panagrolaimus sp. PS1159 TaxID=55785 RepID=A0AC35FVA1_9BILA
MGFTNLKCHLTSNSTKKLFLSKRNVKFRFIHLKWISECIDPVLFHNYLKEVFEFDDLSFSRQISLAGCESVLKELYELFKT